MTIDISGWLVKIILGFGALMVSGIVLFFVQIYGATKGWWKYEK